MAGSSLLLLIDDIATLLDDVAALSKLTVKKTAGVLGDDLALNAQQVTGINADRELSVVWAVAKGSFVNKLILVPTALAISAFIPALITPLLIIGGLFLCYEGVETLIHKLFHSEEKEHREALKNAANNGSIDMDAFEKDKIKGAIRTDFILSAEIIAISLGVVASSPLITQASVLSIVAIMMTIGVYGLVAGIVRLDDWGLSLYQKQGEDLIQRLQRCIGLALLRTAPYLMKALSVFGTIAMFLVGGGILSHGIPILHYEIAALLEVLATQHHLLVIIAPLLLDAILGIIAGLLVFLLFDIVFKRVLKP